MACLGFLKRSLENEKGRELGNTKQDQWTHISNGWLLLFSKKSLLFFTDLILSNIILIYDYVLIGWEPLLRKIPRTWVRKEGLLICCGILLNKAWKIIRIIGEEKCANSRQETSFVVVYLHLTLTPKELEIKAWQYLMICLEGDSKNLGIKLLCGSE